MACKDCLQNCPDIVSDGCVQYTGPDIPALGICQGQSLSQFEAAIVTALLSALDGTGIQPTDVTLENCPWLLGQIGTANPKLNALLKLLVASTCTLKEMIDAINAALGATFAFNTACLPGLPTDPSRDQIIQAIILLLCDIKTTVDAIPSTYVQLTDLDTLVTNIVNNIISGGGQQNSKMVPYVAYEYYGPLSNFSGTGAGISALGFNKVYLCNGGNGTPDKRGRVAVGAVRDVPGGPALDPAVDPTDPLNPNWALNDKAGENTHLLTVAEMPAHNHTVNDPGHAHSFTGVVADGRGADGSKTATPSTLNTATSFTGITLSASGGDVPHNNIQPTIAAYYIMYIP